MSSKRVIAVATRINGHYTYKADPTLKAEALKEMKAKTENK